MGLATFSRPHWVPAESSLAFANPGKEASAQATPLDLTNGSEMEDSRRLDGKLIGPY